MEATGKDVGHEAFVLWEKMQPSIKKIVQKVLGYNGSYELNDYLNESYIACVEALTKYRNGNNDADYRLHSATLGNNGSMKAETFAFWFIEKRIHKMADTGEVAWEVYDSSGNYKNTVFNGEYRRIKKNKEDKGYTFVSKRMTVSTNGNYGDSDNEEIDLPDPVSVTPETKRRVRRKF